VTRLRIAIRVDGSQPWRWERGKIVHVLNNAGYAFLRPFLGLASERIGTPIGFRSLTRLRDHDLITLHAAISLALDKAANEVPIPKLTRLLKNLHRLVEEAVLNQKEIICIGSRYRSKPMPPEKPGISN
jgi:hypothetical protein